MRQDTVHIRAVLGNKQPCIEVEYRSTGMYGSAVGLIQRNSCYCSAFFWTFEEKTPICVSMPY